MRYVVIGGSVVSDIKFQSDKIISESGKKILSNNDIVTKLVDVVNASVRIDVTLKDGSIARRWMFDFSSTGQARVTQLEADERGKVLIFSLFSLNSYQCMFVLIL